MAASFIVEEMIATQRRDVKIVPPIVIVVPDGYAEPIDLNIQPATLGDIGERAVVIIVIECRCGAPPAWHQIFAVNEQDIQPAVPIGIEKGATRPHGFRKPLLSCAASIV